MVDDDDIARYLLRGLFASSGYRFMEANGGIEGLRVARKSKPNLIILDLQMPDMSGFEVLDALKRDPETREIPVVIYTSHVLDSEERARLQAAVDIVPKESRSREAAEARFSEALSRAGLQAKLTPTNEAHV
jgi:CheY-like chemotaxis protein